MFLLDKKSFLVFLLLLIPVFCFSQSVRGQWERNIEGTRIILIFTESTLEVGVISSNGERNFPGVKIEYFASNNTLVIFDYGTGIYAEPLRYEYYISGNTLTLIALNITARISGMEGRYTRIR